VPGAERAAVEESKLVEWVLAERGHGPDFQRAFGVGAADRELVRAALLAHVREHGVVGERRSPAGPGARLYLVYGPCTIAGRRAFVTSVWEVAAAGAPPRLVTAYPRRRGGGR